MNKVTITTLAATAVLAAGAAQAAAPLDHGAATAKQPVAEKVEPMKVAQSRN